MDQKYKYAFNICFSKEKSKAINFLNNLKNNIKKNDKVLCIVDKKTNIETKNILIKYCRSNINYIYTNIKTSKSFAETKLEAIKKSKDFDYIFDLDGNNAHNPKYIKYFKNSIENNNFDAVCSTRFKLGGKYNANNRYGRFIISFFGGKLANFILSTNYTDLTGGYICFNKKIRNHILRTKIYSKAHFYHVELKNIINMYNFTEIPIVYKKSESKLGKFSVFFALINLSRVFFDNLFKKNIINSS